MDPRMAQMPTEKQLWKHEPNKLRIWIVLFMIVLFIFSTTIIVGSILTILKLDEWLSEIVKNSLGKIDLKDFKIKLSLIYIVVPMISGILGLSGIAYFSFVLPKSYKLNTFSNLPQYPLSISYVFGFFGLSMVSFFWYPSASHYTGPLLIIVSSFVSIALWFFTVRVGAIKKGFMRAKAFEEMQRSPEFQEMQEQMKNFFQQANNGQTPNSPFGTPPTRPAPEATQAAANEPTKTNPEATESNEVKELKKLGLTELRTIASKLSISGSDKMNEDDLIKAIIRVTNEG